MVKHSNLLEISWELNEARLAEACGNWAHHMKLSGLEISMGIQDDAYRRFRLIVRVQLTSKFGKLCDHVETRQAECRRPAVAVIPGRARRRHGYSVRITIRSHPVPSTDRIRPWIILVMAPNLDFSRARFHLFILASRVPITTTHTIRAQLASTHPNPSNNN